MGRKSKAKKINKQQDVEVEAKPKRKFFGFFQAKKETKVKNPKKSIKKIKEATQVLKKVDKRKIVISTLVILIVVITFSIGYMLFQKAFRVDSIAKFLPKNETVAFLEFNTNLDHNQVIKATKLLSKNEKYSKENLILKVEKFFGFNYENDIKPWLGRVAGIAIVNSKSGDEINTVYFAELKDKTAFENFLKSQEFKSKIYQGKAIYSGNNLHASVADNYVFFSENEKSISQLLDFQISGEGTLNTEDEYRKVEKNLPLNKMVFFYINFDKVKDSLFKEYAFVSESGLSMATLSPFLRLFDSEGVALVAMENNFALQSYLNFDDLVLNGIQSNDFSEQYTSVLTNYIPKDIDVMWGSRNMEFQLMRLIEILSAGEENTLKIFENFLNNYTKKYFGAETSLKEDIFPLFKEEFAFTVKTQEAKNIYTLLLKLDSPQKNAITIQEIANNFTSIGAIFEPKIVEHVLPDGTVSKEIIAAHEEIVKTKNPYKKTTIHELKMSKQGWGIYFSVFDQIAVISNSLENVKATIDKNNSQENFAKNLVFVERVEPIIKSTDEILYVNFANLLPVLKKNGKMPEVFEIIDTLSSGKNYFNDGIVTISYIYLR